MIKFLSGLVGEIPMDSPPMIFITIIGICSALGLASFFFGPWIFTLLFFGIAIIAALIFENGWVDTEATNPPYMLARLYFGKYVLRDGQIHLEEDLGKRFFFLYGFMSTFKLFDMSQHQASTTIEDVKTVSRDRDDAKKVITQSTGNIVEILYVYHIDRSRASDFVKASGGIDAEKTESKHFAAIEKKLSAAIEAALNQICGDPDNTTVINWEDLASKRDEIASMLIKALSERGTQPFSILEICGACIDRILIADVKPDPDLEERQEEISLAKKQGEVNQAQAKAQDIRIDAYVDGIEKLKKTGLSAQDASSMYATINRDAPARTIFVRSEGGGGTSAPVVFPIQGEPPDAGGTGGDNKKKKKGGQR